MINETLEQKTVGNEHGVVYSYDRERLADLEIKPIIHDGKTLYISKFKDHNYGSGGDEMSTYWQLPIVYPMNAAFRSATTAESLSASASDFKNEVANSMLQTGQYFRTQEGLYINPWNKDSKIYGMNQYDLSRYVDVMKEFLQNLQNLRDKSRKVNGICLGDNDFAFVPHFYVPDGVMSAEVFSESGLARALEHVDGNFAPKLKEIALKYEGVMVSGLKSLPDEYGKFDKKMKFGTIELYSARPGKIYSGDNRVCLKISGVGNQGFAYGVLQDKNNKQPQ